MTASADRPRDPAPATGAVRDVLDEFAASVPYYPEDLSRVMASVVALGGEVFMLRAELEAMRRAAESDPAHAERLRAIRDSAAFAAWLEREERAFASSLLRPIDAAPASEDRTVTAGRWQTDGPDDETTAGA